MNPHPQLHTPLLVSCLGEKWLKTVTGEFSFKSYNRLRKNTNNMTRKTLRQNHYAVNLEYKLRNETKICNV